MCHSATLKSEDKELERGREASRLVRMPPDRAVRARAMAGEIVLFLDKTFYSQIAPLHPGL